MNLPSFEEITNRMFDKDLDRIIDKLVQVIYTKNNSERYVIFKNEKGQFKYRHEKIFLYDENEIIWTGWNENSDFPPAYWAPVDEPNSFYGQEEDIIKEVLRQISESE